MSCHPSGVLAAWMARAGVLLAVLTGVSSCSDYETPVLVTLVGDNPDAEAVQLTPWLGGRMGGELHALQLTTGVPS